MRELPRISGIECVKALEKIGFSVVRQRGSHISLVRDEPLAQLVVPADRELDKGTSYHPRCGDQCG